VWLLAIGGSAACSEDGARDLCEFTDQDGILGEEGAFIVRITADGFDPPTLTEQNLAHVRLTVENDSDAPAGFQFDCRATPNEDGCPEESCFPDASTIAPMPPGESRSAEFQLPAVEGKYVYRTLPSDDRTGEFVIR
jgi:hypothetical protein